MAWRRGGPGLETTHLHEADQEKALDIFRQIHQEAADEMEIIGISLAPNLVGVVNKKLKNAPRSLPSSWMYPDPGPTLPQTWYWPES